MKEAYRYSLTIAFLASLLAPQGLLAQREDDDFMPRVIRTGRSGYMGYRVEQGDTVYYDSMTPVWVFPKGHRGDRKELRKYYKLVYNFNKVYPYALLAKSMVRDVNDYIAENNLRRMKKEKYISKMQKQLFAVYEKPLRNMSISQGRLLLKLIDREVGKSSFSIIKDYKSGITAGFWQGIAKVFGNDLKSRYDPEGDDKMTEYLVEKWKRGEFDALYFSIFWEEPKRPDLKSYKAKFED